MIIDNVLILIVIIALIIDIVLLLIVIIALIITSDNDYDSSDFWW